jgi:hypothetical protein
MASLRDGGQYIPNSDRNNYEFISFSPGFNRVIQGRACQYHLRKRVGSCFAEMLPNGLTHPLMQVVLTNPLARAGQGAAAIDRVGCAGNPRSSIRGKEEDQLSNFAWLADSSQRMGPF